MALLGIYGPHAIGKTQSTDVLVDRLEGTNLPVTVVNADNKRERYWDGSRLVDVRGTKVWQGRQPEKRALLDEIVCDDTHIYVVESARFFGGLHQYIAELYVKYGGGAFFIQPICDAMLFRDNMKARSARANKAYKDDYWTMRKLAYESSKRYTNLSNKYFLPVGLPYETIEVHSDYAEWMTILDYVWSWLIRPLENWYT